MAKTPARRFRLPLVDLLARLAELAEDRATMPAPPLHRCRLSTPRSAGDNAWCLNRLVANTDPGRMRLVRGEDFPPFL